MHAIADLCVVPIGVGVSLSREIALCQKVIADSGLKHQLHAYGTSLEGDWDAIMTCVKSCHAALHASGVARISTTLKIGTRNDKIQSMESKIQSVKNLLDDGQ